MLPERIDHHPLAELDLYEAYGNYAERSLPTAVGFLLAVTETIERLVTRPSSGSPRKLGSRQLRIRRFPYAVVYVLRPAGVPVVAIPHAKRDDGFWHSRLVPSG